VWLWDVDRQLQSRQTFEGNHQWAIWGPEPDCFTVDSDHEGPKYLYQKIVDAGPGHANRLPLSPTGITNGCSWTPDGEELAIVESSVNDCDISILTRQGHVEPFLATNFLERYPEFSPDGNWLVYTSNESGQDEVYIRPYPGPGRAIQVSVRGGTKPAWSRDGREIFYQWRNNRFYSVQLKLDGNRLTPGQPEPLFEGRYSGGDPVRCYDVTPDGRFLLIKHPDEASQEEAIEVVFPTRIQVVFNWFAELREKMPKDE
jgi:Tol biopolymer transport system component